MRGGLAAGAAIPGIVRRRLQAGARAHAGIAAIDRGIEQFGQRRPDRLHVGPRAPWNLAPWIEFGLGFCRVFWDCLVSSPCAGIWGESGAEKRANGPRAGGRGIVAMPCHTSLAVDCQQMSAGRRFGTGRGAASRADVAGLLGTAATRLDDIEMDPAASRASHGPVFGAGAAGDDAQHRQAWRCIAGSWTSPAVDAGGGSGSHGGIGAAIFQPAMARSGRSAAWSASHRPASRSI